jgi:hypothetical protein
MKKTLLCIAVGLLSACGGDLKAPTKENFAKAAQAYLDTQPMCVAVTDANSEVRVNRGFFGGSMDDQQSAPTIDDAFRQSPLLKTFSDQGFITVAMETRTESNPEWPNNPPQTLTYAKVSITDVGKPFYKPDIRSVIGGGAGFCYAKMALVEIGQFTEPSEMRGAQVSRVSFTQKAVDVQPWAEKLGAGYGIDARLKRLIEGQKVTAAFVLTNEGWVHEKLFGR